MTKRNLEYNRLVSAALAGISSVVVVQLVSIDNLSMPLRCSVFLFAVAIPLLAVNVFAVTTLLEYEHVVFTAYLGVLTIGRGLCAVAGLAAVFAHLSHLAAGIFIKGQLPV